MSLNFDYRDVKGLDLTDDQTHETASALALWAMVVGLPGITGENAAEFYARLQFIVKLDGLERPTLTPEFIHKWIGLKVNITPETHAHWSKRTMEFELGTSIRKYKAATK